MTFRPMTPATVERRAQEHAAESERSHADLLARMAENAIGALPPDDPAAYLDRASFWRDTLADHRASCGRCRALPLNHWPHDQDGRFRCCDAALDAERIAP